MIETNTSSESRLTLGLEMPKVTLGWLRVVLAFMVIDLHYGIFKKVFNKLLIYPQNSLHFHFCGDGDIAVSGFFIMSGYLVSEILHNKYPSKSYKDFFHFVISRYLRIFPLFLFVLVLYVIIMTLSGNKIHGHDVRLSNLFLNTILLPYGLGYYFTGLHQPASFIIGPTWTLSLDLVFYPLGFLLLKEKRYLIATIILLMSYYVAVWVASPAAFGTTNFNAHSWWHQIFYRTIEPNMLAFVLGMFANIYLKDKRVSFAAFCVSILALFYVGYVPVFIDYFGAQFLGMASLVVIVVRLAQNGISKYESLFGSFTYSIYLIHIPIWELLHRYSYLSMVTLVLIDIFVALIVAILIEERLIESRRRAWLKSWHPSGAEGAVNFTKYNVIATLLLMISMSYYLNAYLH